MPTVLWIGATRFFYSNEGHEPPHSYAEWAGAVAEFWLDPISLASSHRFQAHELRRLDRLVGQHSQHLSILESWYEFFES